MGYLVAAIAVWVVLRGFARTAQPPPPHEIAARAEVGLLYLDSLAEVVAAMPEEERMRILVEAMTIARSRAASLSPEARAIVEKEVGARLDHMRAGILSGIEDSRDADERAHANEILGLLRLK